jgi:hypothetical protein
MGHVNGLVGWIFKPVLVLLKVLLSPLRRLFGSEESSVSQPELSYPEQAESSRVELIKG